jgi:hypothetical protein
MDKRVNGQEKFRSRKKCFVDFQALATIQKRIFAQKTLAFSRPITLTIFATYWATNASRQTLFRHPLRTYMERTIFSPQLGPE